MITLADCLVCGGRGGYPGPGALAIICCGRCNGNGLDPARNDSWFADVVVSERIADEKSRPPV